MTFFLDNFDDNFFALSVCESFCVSSYYYYYYYISMSDSVFHLILSLLYHLHFGSNSQNQEIISKPHQINLYCNDFFAIVLFQTMQK